MDRAARVRRRRGRAIGSCLVLIAAARAVPALAVPSLDLTSAATGRGQMAVIDAVLGASGGMVAATQNEIFFPLDALDIHAGDCVPDARLASPAINKQLAVNVTADTPFGAPPGTRRLRVGVFSASNTNVIPDGPLFHCAFTVLPQATSGAKTLSNSPSASTPQSKLLAVTGAAGAVTVLDPSISLSRGTVMPAATAQVEARLDAFGAAVLATRDDVFFPADQLTIGAGDCAIDARLTAPEVDKHLTVDVTPDTPPGAPPNTRRLRVAVSAANGNAIADGTLFRCTFTAVANASPGAKVLVNQAFASTASLGETAVTGGDGVLTVVGQPSNLVLDAGEALAGATAPLAGSLLTQGNLLASLHSDIDFPFPELGIDASDCLPDARLAAPDLAKQLTAAVSTETAPGAPPGTRRLQLDVGGGTSPISDGPLFTCTFSIQSGAAPGPKPLLPFASATTAEETTIPVSAAEVDLLVVEPPSPTPTITATPTRTATETRTATATRTETGTKTATFTRTASQTPTITATITVTRTATETSTVTPTITATRTRVPTSTRTPRPTSTETYTETPTATEPPTRTRTPTASPSASATGTATATEVPTSTEVPTPTASPTLTDTPTRTPTETPTETVAPTETPTTAPTDTPSPAPPTATPSPAPCPGDCDGDGAITDQDVRILTGIFALCPTCDNGGVASACLGAGTCFPADLDGDGCVTAAELTRVLSRVVDGVGCR